MTNKTNIFNPPNLERKMVCISDDYILSAQISSCFNDEGVYFAVLEPPRSLHKYWQNEFVMLNNVLAKIHPEKIIFVDVKKEMTDLIKGQLKLSESRYEYINTDIQVKEFVSKYEKTFEGVLECPPDREKITHALLEAKRKHYCLVVNPDSHYEIRHSEKNKHVVISDSSESLLPVTLANYAYSIDSDIHFFKCDLTYSPREIYDILGDTRGNDKRAIDANKITKDIKSTLEVQLDGLDKYEFATFFTDDFQYGYFFPEIPTTHIHNKLLSSHFIASSIIEPYIEIQSALLVDTGFFDNSETDDISKSLVSQGVFVKELRNNQFNNLELDNNIQFFPYDFLFICSHAGFPKGGRFKIKFYDKKGCDHIIVVDILDSFDPTDKGTRDDRIISIKTFTEFVELDGQPWYQKKYKKGSSRTLVEDFIAIDRKDWKVLERTDVEMKYCNVILTKDRLGPYMPMLHSISDPQSAPFIFNNACVSTYTMGVNLVFAGASFYVGTVKSVGDLSAVKIALSYFEKTINEQKSLALSLWESQHETRIPNEDMVYACIGCHFKRFAFVPGKDNKSMVKERIKIDTLMRGRRVNGNDLEKNVKDRHVDAMRFLIGEYKKM